MTGRGALAGVALVLGGCVYYNAIYNAERSFEAAEAHRRLGRDSLAAAAYADVVEKAARGFRQDPGGAWADEALSLVGRAHLRLGDLRAARAALEDALALAPTRSDSLTVQVYLAAARVEAGEHVGALEMLNESLRELRPGPALAEGHYWRARVLLAAGQEEAAWWDLDRASVVDPGLRIPAALARVASAIGADEPERAREGVNRLLATPEAGEVRDSLETLVAGAALRWGPEGAARLLDRVGEAAWRPTERDRARLARARLLDAAGDTAGARNDARAAARGVGAAAGEARLLLAGWLLDDAQDLTDARAVVPVLLPSEDHPGVSALLADLRAMSNLAEVGLDDPIGWFAAAEVARDRLGAPMLARGLFLAYADAAPDAPWSAKALLAALDITADEGDRAWLRGRLEGRSRSPYVLAARGSPAPGFEGLEEELAARLDEVRNR